MKNFFLVIIFLFITQCGYTPIYKGINKQDFKIVIINMKGNKHINNLIRTQLKRYSVTNTSDVSDINVNTKYNKLILTKDKTGKATNLQLSVEATFEINYKNKVHIFKFDENLNIENDSDAYEQRKYENIIKNNFVQSILKKLILKLSGLK